MKLEGRIICRSEISQKKILRGEAVSEKGFCCRWLSDVKSQYFPLQLAVITCSENSAAYVEPSIGGWDTQGNLSFISVKVCSPLERPLLN